MYEILNKDNPIWMEPYLKTRRRPLTKEERKRVEEFQKQLENLPDSEYIPVYDDAVTDV